MTDEPKDVRLPFMATATEAAAIDNWRYDNRIPTRAEAMRRLVGVGLHAHTIAQEIRAILNAAGDPMHHATTGLRHVPHADRLLAGLQAVLGKRTDAAWAFGDKDIDVLRARAAGAQYLAHYLANLADGYEDPVPPAPGGPDFLTIASLLL